MSKQPPPPGWGNDEITQFIDHARSHEYATFANCKEEFKKLRQIDALFRQLISNLFNTKEWFAAFFLLRTHSSYLGAVRLAMSSQVPETYIVLRSALENALYGHYLYKNPSSRETWLRRHDSEAHKKTVRSEFTISRLLEELQKSSKREAQIAKNLYDQTIDYGAHPNERALSQSLQITEGDSRIELKILYLDEDSKPFRLVLRRTAQVGASVLGIFRLVFKERYDILGLTLALDSLKQGL